MHSKKILAMMLLYVVIIASCNNKDSKSENTTADSASLNSTKDGNFAASIFSRRIPKGNANAMRKFFKDTAGVKKPKFYTFDWKIYHELEDHNGEENVKIIPIRYRKEDENNYCKAWKFTGNDTVKCKVANYTSFVIQVTSTNLSDEPSYYEFTTVCPPPEVCGENY